MALIEISQVVLSKATVATKEAVTISVKVGIYATHTGQLPFKLGGVKNGVKN